MHAAVPRGYAQDEDDPRCCCGIIVPTSHQLGRAAKTLERHQQTGSSVAGVAVPAAAGIAQRHTHHHRNYMYLGTIIFQQPETINLSDHAETPLPRRGAWVHTPDR